MNFNYLISTTEIFVIIGIVLFFALVIFLQFRRKKKGKACCSAQSTCSMNGCQACQIKEYIKKEKNDH